jgi:hypothetical protein
VDSFEGVSGKDLSNPIPAEVKGGEALDIVHETAGGLFPGLRQEGS